MRQLSGIDVAGAYSGVNLRKHPPLSPRNRFLVSLSREFCVDYNEKKFTAVKIAESMFFACLLKPYLLRFGVYSIYQVDGLAQN